MKPPIDLGNVECGGVKRIANPLLEFFMLGVCRIRQCLQEIGVAWGAADICGRTSVLSIQTAIDIDTTVLGCIRRWLIYSYRR